MRLPSPFALALLLPVVACSSYKLATPEPNSAVSFTSAVPSSEARVCVVRTSILALAVTFVTHDNEVLVGATQGPTYFCYVAEPGVHDISIDTGDEVARATLSAEAGQTYYLKEEVENLFGVVKCRPTWVTEGVARELVRESTQAVLVGVPGSEKLPSATPYAPIRRSAARE